MYGIDISMMRGDDEGVCVTLPASIRLMPLVSTLSTLRGPHLIVLRRTGLWVSSVHQACGRRCISLPDLHRRHGSLCTGGTGRPNNLQAE